MRLWPLFKKSLLENIRDWKIIILTITFAPFFVLLMHLYFGGTSNTYRVVVINRDQPVQIGSGTVFCGGDELLAYLGGVKNVDGSPLLLVTAENDKEKALKKLKDRSIDLLLEIPADFSQLLQQHRLKGVQENRPGVPLPAQAETHSSTPQPAQPLPAVIGNTGSLSNPRYMMAGAMSDAFVYQYVFEVTGYRGPLDIRWQTVGEKKTLSEFDLYVPCLLALSLIMLMFTAAASLIKEKDKGTIIRLRLSNMTLSEFFVSISMTQVIIGLVALALTYFTAAALGYESSGSLINLMVIGLLSCLAVIAVSLLVAGFLRTIFDLMTIGCFPFFILMFFSGAMFPLPSMKIFSIGRFAVNANDILPITHTISAFNKILNFNAGLGEVFYEMAAIVILGFGYFWAGLWLFKKRHMAS